jgi:hypothetical protein
MSTRKLRPEEEKLIELLVNAAALQISSDWKRTILVEPMNDGGMGSLSLHPKGEKEANRRFGSNPSNAEFLDKDGISVLAGLFLDENGNLFELDMFKGDGSPLIEIPEVSRIKAVKVD